MVQCICFEIGNISLVIHLLINVSFDIIKIGGISGRVPTLGSLLVMPGLVGWLLWVAVIACGGLLAWQERILRSRIGLLLDAVHDLLRLEWFYSAVVGAFGRGISVFRVANEVVGGAGALLWSLLLFLLLLLVWGGS